MSHNSVCYMLVVCRSLAEASRVCEQVNLATLTLHSKVMTELAFKTFCTLPCSEVLAHDGLGVNTCATVVYSFKLSCMQS